MRRTLVAVLMFAAATASLPFAAQQASFTVRTPDGQSLTGSGPAFAAAIQDTLSSFQEKLEATQRELGLPPANDVLKTGTSRISGRVANDTGLPMRQATVRATAFELNGSRTTGTDQDGRYEFADLPAGRYTISASKPNYVGLSYGQLRPLDPGKPVDVARDQRVDRIDLTLARGGVIAGRVLDEYGEPVTDAQVTPLQKRMSQGQLRLLASGRAATTNDIGEFRLFGLQPGQYFVSALLRTTPPTPLSTSDARLGYAATYYPSTAVAANAQPVIVGLGETISGIDLALTTTRLATISGTALDGQGRAVTRGSVSVSERGGAATQSAGTTMRMDGTFISPALPPGEYLLRAMAQPDLSSGSARIETKVGFSTPSTPQILMATVSLNGNDVSGVVLAPIRQVRLSGRVIIDPAALTVPLRSSMVSIRMSPGSPEAGLGMGSVSDAMVMEDFSFQYTVPAAELSLKVSVRHPQLVVKSVRIGGLDITDSGIDLRGGRDVDGVEIELTSRPQEVSGIVVDGRGEALNAAVLIFPQERERMILDSRLIAIARTDRDGRYSIRTLPPGRYVAVAFDPSQASVATQDPEVLEALRARAIPFSLAAEETKTLDLHWAR